MDLIFAKWILAAAVAIGPGEQLDMPPMQASRSTPTVAARIAVADEMDITGWTRTRTLQFFCADQPGVYTVSLRLAMMPLPAGSPEVTGRVWMVGAGETVHLLAFSALAGAWTTEASSTSIPVDARGCFQLVFDATGPATINPDPRATFLTVHKAG